VINVIVLVALGLLLVALGYNIMNNNGKKSAGQQQRKPSPQATPKDKAASGTHRPATSLAMEIPDLSHLVSCPKERDFYLKKEISLENMGEMMDNVADISRKISARSKYLEALSDANYDPKKVSEMVLSDPGLTGEILKTVNSPLYSLPQQVASVFRAIVLLGHVEVRNIIWRSCMSDSKPITDPAQNLFLDQLWRHSFDVSRVAFAIARDCKLPEPDRVSTTALLHDIGKLICFYIWPDKAMGLYSPVGFSGTRTLAEESRIHTWHAAAGSELAHRWGLPKETCASILHSHAPSYVEPEYVDSDPREIAVIYLANLICHNAANRSSSTGDLYLPQPGWLQSLKLFSLEEVFTPSVLKVIPQPRPEIAPSEDADHTVSEVEERLPGSEQSPEKIGLLDSDDLALMDGELVTSAPEPATDGEPDTPVVESAAQEQPDPVSDSPPGGKKSDPVVVGTEDPEE
jgi:putative nucleotidyltransferase with HDIG domain